MQRNIASLWPEQERLDTTAERLTSQRMGELYVSITGLSLHGLRHYPRFMVLAGPAMSDAQSDPSCLHASARAIGGVQHTLTVWTSREAMAAYLTRPHHLRAMKSFSRIGTGRTYGYWAKRRPSWSEARALWEAHATEVGPANRQSAG